VLSPVVLLESALILETRIPTNEANKASGSSGKSQAETNQIADFLRGSLHP
jgi:hypothetical protein